MASNPPVDLSGEILDFRRVLSWTLTQKLYDLEKELDRIKLILYPEEEDISMSQPQVLSFTPDAEDYSGNQSNLKVVGHIDLTQFDPKKGKRRERISGGKVVIPSYCLSSKEAAEVFPERKALLESFLRNAAEDASYVRDCFLLRSTLQYAVIRKEISYLDCDYYVIRPYAGVLPSSDELAEFLVDSYRCARKFTRDILTMLADRHRALPLLDAVCDNPFIYGKNPDLDQAKKVISDAIAGLGSGQVTFRKDMNAIMVALDNYVLQDLGIYISMAKKITRDAFSLVEFPLNEDKIEMLQFGELEFSTYPEGKDEYLKALTGALHEAEEKGLFSASERCAIIGEEVPVTVLPNGEEPTMPKPETRAESDTVNNNQITINATHPSPTGKQTASPMDRLVLPKDRMDRPLQYLGNEEKAFPILYTLMNGAFFECSSLDNFTGLFKCPADNTKENYTKINWIHSSGERGLQYFLEALYRKKDDEPSSLKRARASRVFLVNGKIHDLGKNLLYCWGKNKRVDPNHYQEKEIRGYLQLIHKSKLKEG